MIDTIPQGGKGSSDDFSKKVGWAPIDYRVALQPGQASKRRLDTRALNKYVQHSPLQSRSSTIHLPESHRTSLLVAASSKPMWARRTPSEDDTDYDAAELLALCRGRHEHDSRLQSYRRPAFLHCARFFRL